MKLIQISLALVFVISSNLLVYSIGTPLSTYKNTIELGLQRTPALK